MQTILGAGGAIGKFLARELAAYTDQIRLVSRNPEKENPGDELFPADLTDREQVLQAVEGSDVVYLTIGFPYNIRIWRSQWPALMRNVIEACRIHGSRLVFFDNIYMYDRNALSPMTETTPVNPSTKKGKVRAQIAQMLMQEVEQGNITALIARSADFYGPGTGQTSVMNELVYKNFLKGKKANWFADAHKKQSFTYTQDAAKATAMLGNTPDAFNQVWHLPTHPAVLTGEEWIQLFARIMKTAPRYSVMPQWLASTIGVFVPIMKELAEMFYQYDRDYIFDSSRFERRFQFRPTTYEEGVIATVQQTPTTTRS